MSLASGKNCSLLKKVLVRGVYIAQVLTRSFQSTLSVCIPKGSVCSVVFVNSKGIVYLLYYAKHRVPTFRISADGKDVRVVGCYCYQRFV